MSADIRNEADASSRPDLQNSPYYQKASCAFDFFINEDLSNAAEHGPELECICGMLQKICHDVPQGVKALHDMFVQSYLHGIKRQASCMPTILDVTRDLYRAVLNDRSHTRETMQRYIQIKDQSPHLSQNFFVRVQHDLCVISQLAYREGSRYKPGLA